MKARGLSGTAARPGTKTRPAREPVVETIADAEKRRPFIANGPDGNDSVLMRVSDESEIGLSFAMSSGEIGEIDLDEGSEEWTFVRYLTDAENVQIVGG